jgi:uncharacterized protein (TIGR02246 family)
MFHEDGIWILWTGAVWTGRRAIEDGHAEVHKTIFRNSTQRELLEELTFVGPDSAVVRFCSTLIGDERSPDKLVRSRKILVVTKRDGNWGVSWGQNTRLADTVPDSECFVELRKRNAAASEAQVDIGANGIRGSQKALKVPLNGVVRVELPSGQIALVQFTAIAESFAEYRWKYRRTPGADVLSGTGRVEEKYQRHTTSEQHQSVVEALPGHDVTVRAGGILAQWSVGGGEYCYFYYDSKLARATVLKASEFEKPL